VSVCICGMWQLALAAGGPLAGLGTTDVVRQTLTAASLCSQQTGFPRPSL